MGGGPDVVYICVSNFSNLCKPCATTEGCKSVGAADVCVSYGEEGSFCGGACGASGECPWGFSCVEAQTVDGEPTQQCVADAGVCPCAAGAVDLALTTPCEKSNDYGTCLGKRVCTEEGLTACDASETALENCDGMDNDCNGLTDEGTCGEGNDCTEDSCAGVEGCVNVALDSTECKDGDPCTVADHCEAGVCMGSPVECDDGNVNPGDGCNAACQYESYVYTLPFTPDDFDVAYDGRMTAVGREGSTVVAQCFRADRQAMGGKFTVLSAPAGAVVEHVHMGMAGQVGYWGVFVRHQTVAGDWGSRRGAFRMYDGQCQPVTDAFIVQDDQAFDEARDMDVDEKGNAFLAWMGTNKKMYLAIVAPDGSWKLAPRHFDTCGYNYGLQLAVQPNGSRGVVTCQGHDGNPIWFWLFDSAGDFSKSGVQVQGAPPSSWYISHEVGMNAAGQFVVLWAANGVQQFKANFHDESGTLTGQGVAGSTVSGSCYDPFRNDNTKIQSPGGDFILPYVLPQDGPCHQGKHHGFHRMSPTGESVTAGTSAFLTHTLVVDNFGNTYVRDGNKIRLNEFQPQ